MQIEERVLEKMGGNNPLIVHQTSEIYRWLTACFLHANFIHILSNSVAIIFIGSVIEPAWGWFDTSIIYICSGISGNLFSSVITSDPNHLSVGASACIFGLVSCIFSFYILNWQYIKT